MGVTDVFDLPFPELEDTPDGATQMEELAWATEGVLVALRSGIPLAQAGAITMNASPTVPVSTCTGSATFARAFPSAPIACVNIGATAGNTKTWVGRNIGTSTTAITGWAYSVDNTAIVWTHTLGYIAVLNASAALPLAARALAATTPEGWFYVTATCHTAGCPKEDEAVPEIMVPDDPVEWGWTGITCGVCQQPMTDIAS